jgi:hypothetical protein
LIIAYWLAYANPERSVQGVILGVTRVTRGKVSVHLQRWSGLKGRATPIRKNALYWSTCNVKVQGVVLWVLAQTRD